MASSVLMRSSTARSGRPEVYLPWSSGGLQLPSRDVWAVLFELDWYAVAVRPADMAAMPCPIPITLSVALQKGQRLTVAVGVQMSSGGSGRLSTSDHREYCSTGNPVPAPQCFRSH